MDDDTAQRYALGEHEQLLERLAELYHEQTEAYDRTVCSIRHNGVALPADTREVGLITRNALDTLERLAFENGVSRHQLLRAIQEYHNGPRA